MRLFFFALMLNFIVFLQRVHYEIKKELAWQRQLEFEWVQTWEADPTDLNHESVGEKVSKKKKT